MTYSILFVTRTFPHNVCLVLYSLHISLVDKAWMKSTVILQARSFHCSISCGLMSQGTGIVPLQLPTRAPILFIWDLLFLNCFHNSLMRLKDNIDLYVNQYFKAKCVMLLFLLFCELEVSWQKLHANIKGLCFFFLKNAGITK